jgi:hypothetical protein
MVSLLGLDDGSWVGVGGGRKIDEVRAGREREGKWGSW